MQLPGYLEFEIYQHHIKETLTDIIGITLTHNAQSYAGFWLPTSMSDTIEIHNLTLMHVTMKKL